MNMQEFNKQFPDEETCRQYLEQMIWPSGRICPHCGGLKSWNLSSEGRRSGLYECAACGNSLSPQNAASQHQVAAEDLVDGYVLHDQLQQGNIIRIPCEVDRHIPEDSLESWSCRSGKHGLTGRCNAWPCRDS